MDFKKAFFSLFMLPLCAFAGVTGNYTLEGHDPVTGDYTGTLAITRADSVYTGNWTFSNGPAEVGTGVRKDNSLAFVFNGGLSDIGVQLYTIRGDTLEGPWVDQGATQSGFETATKVQTHCHHHSHH